MDNFSMQNTGPRHIRTGGDPRPFPDFTALRDEMSKQSHPARPDIHWDRVEHLSLALFEKNGIELQTGAWYTLARSHLAQVSGMNEGLNIIIAMLGHQWAQFWPQASHARAEILSGLFQRLQKVFRTFSLSHHELQPLRQLERTLAILNDILTRQALLPASLLTPLQQQVQNALTRLENAPEPETQAVDIVPPMNSPLATEPAVTTQEPHLLYVIRQEPPARVDVAHEAPPAPKLTRVFLGGMLTAFVLSAVTFTGWQRLTRPDDAEQMLAKTLPPLPRLPDVAVLSMIRKNNQKDALAERWLVMASDRLKALSTLPPGWSLRYGQNLVWQANALWPSLPATRRLENQWQYTLALNAIAEDSLTGWHEGMRALQALTAQLNALDGHKGKYITVSELKSQVFAATQAFNRTIPVEEQLRQMSAPTADNQATAALSAQTKQHLSQLLTRYVQIHQTEGGSHAIP
ncbi:VasL domain-containing protein [Klebsiella aerogenes]